MRTSPPPAAAALGMTGATISLHGLRVSAAFLARRAKAPQLTRSAGFDVGLTVAG